LAKKNLKKKEYELEDATGKAKLASGFKLMSHSGKVVNA
jgi:hypothetical protein